MQKDEKKPKSKKWIEGYILWCLQVVFPEGVSREMLFNFMSDREIISAHSQDDFIIISEVLSSMCRRGILSSNKRKNPIYYLPENEELFIKKKDKQLPEGTNPVCDKNEEFIESKIRNYYFIKNKK